MKNAFCLQNCYFHLINWKDGAVSIRSFTAHIFSVKYSNVNIEQYSVSVRFSVNMSANSEKNLDRLERKAILEAEKRKKPGECLKVRKLKYIILSEYGINPFDSTSHNTHYLVCSSNH